MNVFEGILSPFGYFDVSKRGYIFLEKSEGVERLDTPKHNPTFDIYEYFLLKGQRSSVTFVNLC